jgi:rod shape-determining protein MreD
MRWLRFAVLILIAMILQTSLLGIVAVPGTGVKPDLLLILLVFFAVRCQASDAVIVSFTIGFAADLISPTMGLMGPRIISFGLFGTVLSELHSVISTRRLVHQAVTIFLMGVLTALLTHLLTLLRAEADTASRAAQFFGQPLYSALVGPFLSVPVSWWMHMSKRSRSYRRIRALSR